MTGQQTLTTQNTQPTTARKTTTRLDLSKVAFKLGLANVEYDPESFPAVVYRVKDSRMVVTLYASGRMEVIGATSIEEVEHAKKQVAAQLQE